MRVRMLSVLAAATIALAGCNSAKSSAPSGQGPPAGRGCATSFLVSARVGPVFLQSVGEVNYPIAWFLNLQIQHTALGSLLQVNSQQDEWSLSSNVHKPSVYVGSGDDSGSVSSSSVTLTIADGGPMDGKYIGTWKCNSLSLTLFGSQNVANHTYAFSPTTYVRWSRFVGAIERRYPLGFYCQNGSAPRPDQTCP
jgi:hypothetical protein